MKFREIRLKRDPECPVCGDHATIRELQDYEQFCGTTIPDQAAGFAEAADFDVAPEDLRRALGEGQPPLLLDVREPMEFQLARLPDALLVPLGDLAERLGELDGTRDIVVYCHHGIRSVHATHLLRAAGFRARNLEGGIAAWADRVDPTMVRY
jgi:adenylyltransferase/sulfurtransferase